jgi:hypothetical protein
VNDSTEKADRAKSALTGKWVRAGDFAVVRGEMTCGKYIVAGKPVYVLFDGDKRVGQYDTFEEAKAA